MVISHTHRYLFIEIPLTGSWALRNELCNLYDGTPILHKHATYPEFRRIATPDELKYFVFGTVRNPLDVVVSRYFKLKNDHKGVFSSSDSVNSLEADYSDLLKHQFVQRADVDFVTFFRKYHQRPFGDLIDVESSRYNKVLHYERLQDEFASVLNHLGIAAQRVVPFTNRTEGKAPNWDSYYTAEVRKQAVRIFTPFMHKWGYDFPSSWGESRMPWRSQIEYSIATHLRNLYYCNFRYSNSPTAQLVRKMRAQIIN